MTRTVLDRSLGLLAAALLLLSAARSASAAPAEEIPLLRFQAEKVDGVDVLVFRDGTATIEHRAYRPMEGWSVTPRQSLPKQGRYRVLVRERKGRPGVRVLQQPVAENDYELRVLIDDGPAGGDARLSFELVAIPVLELERVYNVVILTIDSLRPDRLSLYGHERETSPHLDRFAEQCQVFENAFSTSSFTPPSHASLLTSRYVGDHGLFTWNQLPNEQLTLPEVLTAHGFRTGACVSLELLSQQNLGQGIDYRREGHREARRIIDEGLEFLRTRADEPFFLWMHLYDVHRPYGRIPGWENLFAAERRPGIGDSGDHYGMLPEDVAEQGLYQEDLDYIVDRYDAGIAYTDAQLAPLFAELSTRDRRDDTLVIVTADHGESLLDHPERLFTHDPFLFSAVSRIPLLIRYPDGSRAGSRSDDLVSLIDLAPTVLGALGVKQPPTFQGLDLARLERHPGKARSEIFLECWGWERLKAVRTLDQLVLRDMEEERTLFFDLSSDPAELNGAERPPDAAARELRKKLIAFATRRPQGEGPPELSPEILEQLRQLGYLDG